MRDRHLGLIIGLILLALGLCVALIMPRQSLAIATLGVFACIAVLLTWLNAGSDITPAALLKSAAPPAATQLEDLLRHPDFDAVLCGLPLPALVVADARVMAANPAAMALLGTHILGADVRTAIRHPAAADKLANPKNGSAGSLTELVGLGRGNQKWDMRTVALSNTARLVLLEDQTALATAERMRSDFVANASHELRTPLASILGFVETLQDDDAATDPATRHRFLSVIDAEARRMQQLVDDLISLSRIEAEKYQQPEGEVNLGVLAQLVLNDIRRSQPDRAADIVDEITANLPYVRGDAGQLSQMLHNILGNALKYGHLHTPVHLSIGLQTPDLLHVLVTDQSDGISDEHIVRLTERFYRVDSARSRALGGTGLGLSIVKHIVERHRGRMEISSQLGVGTSVHIHLPIAD
jgi:two-component system, OmpR family, phosphate regulon sensor histidine kinase PhoR